ncbi:MAG: hypothetical protein IPK13_09185 [Deltaproteobacteria bacterium]|nr:hypothetical protein [Deltaproteobacteria bacterium]
MKSFFVPFPIGLRSLSRVLTRLGTGIGVLLLMSGCQATIEPGTGVAPSLGSTTDELAVFNTLGVNGLSNNGLYVNGLSFNSYVPNGLYVNGLPLNGLPLNGLYVNGLYVNGVGVNGLPVNGLPLNGLYVNGLPLNGLPVNGLPLNGLYVNGLPLNGLYVNGLPVNGLPLNGLSMNGLYVNGLPLNGLYVNGLYPNGLYVNGLPLNGLPLNGLYVNGSNPATAIKIATSAGELVDLTADQEAAFESMIAHLVWCAIPDRQNVSIYGSNGRAVRYPGHHGLAPDWKTSALVDDASGIDDSEELRWCVEHYRAVASDNSLYEGLALNAQQLKDLEVLLKYAISCALPAGDSVAIEFPSGTKTFDGALGLAPGWKTGALDLAGQKAVSACLGARTNALGQTVRISLRSANYASLTVTPLERANFKTHEGAFWGNVFGTNPELHACKVEGGGPAGRLCTDGSCGFTPDPLPSCDAPALGGCDAKDADGNWTHCGPNDESEVLNTFLMTETMRSTSFNHTCQTAGNEVWCWGNGASGKLGDGTTMSRTFAAPVSGLPNPDLAENLPVEVALGPDTSCARLRGGTLWCWGGNLYGQIGDGTTWSRVTPVQVADLGNAVADVSMGFENTCALKMDGTVWCWGSGFVGDGIQHGGLVGHPVQAGALALGHEAVQVSSGWAHTCALKMDQTVWCWGSNQSFQLGLSGTSVEYAPVRLTHPDLDGKVVRLYTGSYHACALLEDQSVWCWGENYDGQCGAPSVYGTTPVEVTAVGHEVVDVATGNYHTCALKEDGSVWCWGWNGRGQLGTGNTQSSVAPVQMQLPGAALEIEAGLMSTYATLEDGSVWATGSNDWGELGVGAVGEQLVPALVTETVGSADAGAGGLDAGTAGLDAGTGGLDAGTGGLDAGTGGLDAGTGGLDAGTGGSDAGSDVDAGAGSADAGGSSCGPPECALLTNPGFEADLTGWAASDGLSASYGTKSCRTGSGCATLSNRSEVSLASTVGVVGQGDYAASIWVKSANKRGSVTAYLEIEERTGRGDLVGITSGTQLSASQGYVELSVSRAVSSPTNVVYIRVVKTSGSSMLIDDAELLR